MSESPEAGRLKSPPFPAIPLQKAIDRADQLYRQERDHLVPIASAARAWGMSPTSSSPIQTVGALKQYGLIDDEGAGTARKVRLTRDALRIVLDKSANSSERVAAIQRCFLSPKIFAELWQKWGSDLPSEQTMINHLVLDRKLAGAAPFSDQGAAELLGNYRASMSFAAPEGDDNGAVPGLPGAQETLMQAEITPDPAPSASSLSSIVAGLRAKVDEGERVIFVEEGTPGQRLKIVASGELDEFMLEALQNFIDRRKRRLRAPEYAS